MSEPLEIRPVPGYEDIYGASADGRIWSYPRTWMSGERLQIRRSHDGKWLAPKRERCGYDVVILCKEGRIRHLKVHRLVAMAWHPNPLSLPQVNHLNGVKHDNVPGNLEWCTASENRKHGFRTGLMKITDAMRRASANNIRNYMETKNVRPGPV